MKKTALSVQDLVASLADDLMGAQDHYRIYGVLVQAAEVEHSAAISDRSVFWHYTIRAHRDAAIMHLSRAYDITKGACSLHALLKMVASSTHRYDLRQLVADSAAIGAKTPNVRELLKARNCLFAHTDLLTAIEGASKLAQTFPLPAQAIWQLIETGLAIIERYRGPTPIPARSWGALHPTVIAPVETRGILEALDRDLLRQTIDEIVAEAEADDRRQ